MRTFITASAMVALVLGVWGCGANSYTSGGSSGSPSAPTPTVSGIVTINVVAINGAQSFSPNPATLPAGR